MSPRSWAVIPSMIILGLISCAVVGARLWTRRVLQKRFGLEDWLIVVAALLTVCLLGGIVLATNVFGYDKSSTDLTASQLVWAARWLFVAEFTYIIDTCLIKIAILLFYLRLADTRVSKAFVYTVYVCIADILTYKTIYLLIICLSCQPLRARWDQKDPAWAAGHKGEYTCLDEMLNLLVGSTISATEDLVIALLPSWLFWRLRMPWKKKLVIMSLFLTSTLTCVAGYVRSYFVYRAFWTSEDYIHALYWLWIMSGMEVSIGIICSSVPALKPFMIHFKISQRVSKTWHAATATIRRATNTINTNHTSRKSTLRKPGATSQASTLPLYAHDKGGIFDGTTQSGVPTTISYASATFDLSCNTNMDEDDQDTPGGTVIGEDGRQDEMEQQAVSELNKDMMFISVRSSITVDHEQGRKQLWDKRRASFDSNEIARLSD